MPQIFNLKALAQAYMTSSKKTKIARRDSGVDDASPLLRMFDAATRWLAANAPYVDSLNVFPVPDGDTGTNMLFTLRAAYKAAEECPDPTLGPRARALAWGALMEARGNSGVILSQILRGFADGIDRAGELDGQTLARSLSLATESAYKGVESPVEGTMLTVIKDTARAAETAANAGGNLEDVLSDAVREAEASVLRTPDLLPVLKEADVVDAGGQGVFLILEGALKGLTNQPLGEAPPALDGDAIARVSVVGSSAPAEQVYGNCTQFIIRGQELDSAEIRAVVSRVGQSTVVVGERELVRVHTHSFAPDEVVELCMVFGEVSQVSVQDMDEQHAEWLRAPSRVRAPAIGIVAIVPGPGIEEVFSSLGVGAFVPGGQSMNPSVGQILEAVESLSAESVIVLPNNKNVVLTACKAAEVSSKQVEVVPTTNVPQGVAGVLAFNLTEPMDDNVESMREALDGVYSLEISRAVRSTSVDGIPVRKGDAIGILDGELTAACPEPEDVVRKLAPRLELMDLSLATVYSGEGVTESQRARLIKTFEEAASFLEVEMIHGGQPHYQFIVSLE